jgi:hypothetical protein
MSDGAMPLFFGYKTTLVHPFTLRMEGGGRRRVHKEGKTQGELLLFLLLDITDKTLIN